ncbi:hypothetical protein NM208_g16016 [Fusarium decemcellulare]|uniref:Uncharacterized protein n=1 Tax=Fusarium decemcellulare TaxID=57161 RepID=A0ACC1RBX4_9HYPO|nr:hypothetical protein NM208_g16016 [Fusarium decemcellulare]
MTFPGEGGETGDLMMCFWGLHLGRAEDGKRGMYILDDDVCSSAWEMMVSICTIDVYIYIASSDGGLEDGESEHRELLMVEASVINPARLSIVSPGPISQPRWALVSIRGLHGANEGRELGKGDWAVSLQPRQTMIEIEHAAGRLVQYWLSLALVAVAGEIQLVVPGESQQ